MTIKVTDKILSIPPHVSTTWAQISALHMKGGTLAITLMDGDTLHIPNLDSETIQLIFHYHALYLEKGQIISKEVSSPLKEMIGQGEPSVRVAFGSSMNEFGGIMEHNPNQANAPDLPPEILQKIGAIAKIIAPTEDIVLPKAEVGCNCFHCQIARALDAEIHPTIASEPIEVSEEDLHFQQWTITQIGEQLYSVVNCLDDHEKYNVYLGQPIGCTCGKEGCEHILAVLKS